jgi:uncharacterized membrane protein YphA (DoxX/SURF4 family)
MTFPHIVRVIEQDLGLMGGFLLLCITGAGKYSIDALSGIAAP